MFWPAWGMAQAKTEVTQKAALQAAMEGNPEVRAAFLEVERAGLQIIASDYLREPVLTANAGYRYGSSPQLGRNGAQLITTSALTLGTGLRYTLPVGTQLAAELEFGRTVRDSVILGNLGAAYDTGLSLSVVQPWLRGFGRDVVDSGRKSARIQEQMTRLQALSAASAVALDVLTSYWSLWSAQREVEIQEESLKIAQKTLEDAKVRLEAEMIAEADVVPLELEVVSVEERLETARLTLRQRAVELARVMGKEPGESVGFEAREGLPGELGTLSLSVALAQADERSYELLRLQRNVELAQLDADLAQNEALPRLDSTVSLTAAGLSQELGDSWAQLATFDAVILFVGLNLELPLINKRRRSLADRATLAVDQARANYARAKNTLHTQIATLVNQSSSATRRLELAERTVVLSQKNLEAQQTRFEADEATSLDVAQAQQSLRSAKLKLVQLQVEVMQQRLSLQELTGALLSAQGVEIKAP